jgi:hypothetical protein
MVLTFLLNTKTHKNMLKANTLLCQELEKEYKLVIILIQAAFNKKRDKMNKITTTIKEVENLLL